MNIKAAALLVILLTGSVVLLVLCNRPLSNTTGGIGKSANRPEAAQPPAGSTTPAWVNTVLRYQPQGGWDDDDEEDQFKSMISSIENDPYHISRLAEIIADTSAHHELVALDSILEALVRSSVKLEYIDLAHGIESRSRELRPLLYPVMIYARYNYKEVQEFMLPILKDETVEPATRSAAARWLRIAWEREPFPEAIKTNEVDFLAVLDSCQVRKFSDPADKGYNQMFFFDLLLSLLKTKTIDCDEAIDRLEANLREVTGPGMRGEKDWRVAEIREFCG